MNRTKYLLITIGIVGLAIIIYFIVVSNPTYQWTESYQERDNIPYGSEVLKEMVKRKYEDQNFTLIEDSLHLALAKDSNAVADIYFFIGERMFLDSLELSSLLKWVESGNRCFISSNNFNGKLLDTLLVFPPNYQLTYELIEYGDYTPSMRSYMEDTVYLDLHSQPASFDSTIELIYVRNHYPLSYAWKHFPSELITQERNEVEALGNFDVDHTNFIRFPYGEGEFYLHSTPLVFTNFNLLSQRRFEYARKCLAHIEIGDIYWDGYNRNYEWLDEYQNSGGGTQYEHSEGPLAFILSERGLRTAWTILLVLGFLYLVFGSKRKQRPIPVVHAPTNTSLEYAETIGTMFRAENNHLQLSVLKMDLFLSWIRERYAIRTITENETEEAQLIAQLAVKSDVPQEQVEDIFTTFKKLSKLQDSEGRGMILFHQKLEAFYQKAR